MTLTPREKQSGLSLTQEGGALLGKDRCLETRLRAHGFRARRYRRPDGTRYSTIEIPMEVWYFVLGGSGARRTQLDSLILQSRLLPRLLAGDKPLALEHETGVPSRTLFRWRQKAIEKKPEANQPSPREALRKKMVERMMAGEMPVALSRSAGVPRSTLERWRNQARRQATEAGAA